MTIAAPVAVAVPPRLDLTVTVVGGTRTAGVTLVLEITADTSVFQNGAAPHTAPPAVVPGGSAAVKSSGTLIGSALLPGTMAGKVLLKKVAAIVMPSGGGVAVEVRLMVSSPL